MVSGYLIVIIRRKQNRMRGENYYLLIRAIHEMRVKLVSFQSTSSLILIILAELFFVTNLVTCCSFCFRANSN